MGLLSTIWKHITKGQVVNLDGSDWRDDPALAELYAEACYRDMALWTGIDLIAKSISKCEWRFFNGNKEEKGPEWYRWNVEPNLNQNSSEFLRKIIATLYTNPDGCLIIEQGEQLLVADSFEHTKYALYPDVFEQVTVGDFTFSKKFYGNEVMHLNLMSLENGKTVQSVIQCVANSYAKLLAYNVKSYQTSRGSKAKLKVETLPPHIKEEERNQWIQEQIKKYSKFISADGGVALEWKGVALEPFNRETTYSNESTRDIRAMIDDISDFTSKSLGIHPALLRGDVQGVSDAMDQFLTFCIDPLVDMIREEYIRKSIKRSNFLAGRDMRIDTKQIKHIDLLNAAPQIDKLIGSGVVCVNDIKKMTGDPIIDEPWAWEHVRTKNYGELETPKGGESE